MDDASRLMANLGAKCQRRHIDINWHRWWWIVSLEKSLLKKKKKTPTTLHSWFIRLFSAHSMNISRNKNVFFSWKIIMKHLPSPLCLVRLFFCCLSLLLLFKLVVFGEHDIITINNIFIIYLELKMSRIYIFFIYFYMRWYDQSARRRRNKIFPLFLASESQFVRFIYFFLLCTKR